MDRVAFQRVKVESFTPSLSRAFFLFPGIRFNARRPCSSWSFYLGPCNRKGEAVRAGLDFFECASLDGVTCIARLAPIKPQPFVTPLFLHRAPLYQSRSFLRSLLCGSQHPICDRKKPPLGLWRDRHPASTAGREARLLAGSILNRFTPWRPPPPSGPAGVSYWTSLIHCCSLCRR